MRRNKKLLLLLISRCRYKFKKLEPNQTLFSCNHHNAVWIPKPWPGYLNCNDEEYIHLWVRVTQNRTSGIDTGLSKIQSTRWASFWVFFHSCVNKYILAIATLKIYNTFSYLTRLFPHVKLYTHNVRENSPILATLQDSSHQTAKSWQSAVKETVLSLKWIYIPTLQAVENTIKDSQD
jgi:hypothetical protein